MQDVDLTEAGQRIFRRHWALIILFTLIGLAVPVAMNRIEATSYVGTARLDLGPDPHGGQDSTSLGDTAQGLATSPSTLKAALKAQNVHRDVDTMLANNVVTVTPVGTSGVLDVSVVDNNAKASAKIANGLADQIVRLRDDAEFGSGRQLLAQLQQQEAALSQQIAAVVEQAKRSSLIVPGLQAQQADLSAQRASIDQQVQALSQQLATTPRPQVIDNTSTVGVPTRHGFVVLLALGGLLGLVVGVAVAATLEAARPTLAPDAVARRLNTPILGRVPRPKRGVSRLDPWLVSYVGVAAQQAGVTEVQLVPVGRRPADVSSLAAALDAELSDVHVVAMPLAPGRSGASKRLSSERSAETMPLTPGRYGAEVPAASGPGIVVVAPASVKSRFLAPLERHVQVTKQQVVGLIVYRGRLQQVSSTAPHDVAQDDAPAMDDEVVPPSPAPTS